MSAEAEDMDRTVSSNPFIFDQLKILGVGANVWDDILDELFDEPFGNIAGPFGFLLADLNGKIGPRRLDYSRPEGISDHDYLRKLLRQSIEELSSDLGLPDDDGSDCDKALEEYWAYRASLNRSAPRATGAPLPSMKDAHREKFGRIGADSRLRFCCFFTEQSRTGQVSLRRPV